MLKDILFYFAILYSLYASTITEINIKNVQEELKEAFAVCLKHPLNQPTSTPSISGANLEIPMYFLFGDGPEKVLRKKAIAKPQSILAIAKAKLPAILVKSTFKPLWLLLNDDAKIYKKLTGDLSKISQIQTEMNAKNDQRKKIKTSYGIMVKSQEEFHKIIPSLRANIIFTVTLKDGFKRLLAEFGRDLDIFIECVKINSLDRFAKYDDDYAKYNGTVGALNQLLITIDSLNSFMNSDIQYFDKWKKFISLVNNWSVSSTSLEGLIESILGENTKDPELKNIHETVESVTTQLSKEIDELEAKKEKEEKHVTVKFNGKSAVNIIKQYGSLQDYFIYLVQLATNELFKQKEMKANFEMSANDGLESVKLVLIVGSVLLLGTSVVVTVLLILRNRERMKLKSKEIVKDNDFFQNL